jgi:beta-glucosidase/6-phospho-beta-glucosidase/beta-galactosidase
MPPSDPGQAPLEMWGGIECSHVRIGSEIRDQSLETGHRDRPGDLDLVAGMGVRTMRYPVIWSTVAAGDGLDFAWHDVRLAQLRRLGIRPIAGLLHHGWGPGDLHALHPDFVDAFAGYAEAIARRYPWIADYTPINEPVTTARFSYLYGHWYPHLRDEAAFLRAVAACARATAEAMRRIRRHRPDARLVQTEDFGRVFAAGYLGYQADHENARRFLGTDLLTGRVGWDHPFHDRLRASGVGEDDLACMRDAPCAPDLLGLDYYLTSDRFLDPDLGRHPLVAHGGNGRQRYADTAAVHQPELRPHLGFLPRLRELHDRYALPLSVTEAHAACTREEQVRWLCAAWSQAQEARRTGVRVESVTSWAMFGAVDWSSLLLRRDGQYESGAFSVRDGSPRRTAVGDTVEALCAGGDFPHSLAEGAGWWAGSEAAPSGLSISLSGLAEHLGDFYAHCRERGVAIVSPSAGPSGHIRIDGTTGGAVRLTLRHAASAAMVVRDEVRSEDLCKHAHDLLDDLIDAAVAAGAQSQRSGSASGKAPEQRA